MNIFQKIADWATNNSVNFQKENEVYKIIEDEFNAINNLLDYYLKSDIVLQYHFLIDNNNLDLLSLNDFIILKRKQLVCSESEEERKILSQEIKQLEETYRHMYEKLKNYFLKLKELYEVQEHVLYLNKEIYQNISLEPFQEFLESSILTKQWTMEELEKLRRNISFRREIIIPYLGQIQERK